MKEKYTQQAISNQGNDATRWHPASKDVIVRTIQDNYIGCEFTLESAFRDRTLGFYLMK